MKIVFAGTPVFGAATLKAISQRHQISAVLTMPDRRAGRGMKNRVSPVKEFALSSGFPILQPETLKDPEFVDTLRPYSPDVIVVAAYGSFFPDVILELPTMGCINVHASLLPRHRGASPINQSILSGDRVAGVSIIRMTNVLDAGPVILSLATPVLPRMDALQLHDVLAVLGGKAICIALDRLEAGVTSSAQCEKEATYAPKLDRRYVIDWSKGALELDRFVRAFGAFPGVYSTYDYKLIKILSLEPVCGIAKSFCGVPGTVLSVCRSGAVVACGDGFVRLLSIQKPGGKRLPAFEFSLGSGLAVGCVLGLGSIV
ncbi:methionyl-tRNA formyltransferase [Candidatus Ichthyocystis hellenicum]|uniref:methionyl-tRNA formyltransferase n=1 Tax=Candidatus Ichthyocystis hellenicum TaxID=1561003 RepID=UPI000AEAC973|nr:methionyl-tRNA formyltransferase [Candidatus Ichthyocystis hellenicum]